MHRLSRRRDRLEDRRVHRRTSGQKPGKVHLRDLGREALCDWRFLDQPCYSIGPVLGGNVPSAVVIIQVSASRRIAMRKLLLPGLLAAALALIGAIEAPSQDTGTATIVVRVPADARVY